MPTACSPIPPQNPCLFSLKSEAVPTQNRPAVFSEHKVAQPLGGGSILGPREDHPALFPGRISINRHFPKASLVPQGWRERKRVADESDFRCAAVDELGRLHHAVAKHESVFYLVKHAQALHGRLRCSAVRCMTRVGDGNPTYRRAAQCLYPELLDFDGRIPRHPDDESSYAINKFAVGKRQALPNEPAGIVDVSREKDVEGGAIGKLRVKVSGRAVRDQQIEGRALSTKCFDNLFHREPEIRCGSDADRTLFGCPGRVRAISEHEDGERWKSDADFFQPIPHKAPPRGPCPVWSE